jgi:hypothetical protein
MRSQIEKGSSELNNQKPEFKAPQIKQVQQQRYKYETKVVATSGLAAEVAERIQRKLDSASDGGFRLIALYPMSSETILIFEKDIATK